MTLSLHYLWPIHFTKATTNRCTLFKNASVRTRNSVAQANNDAFHIFLRLPFLFCFQIIPKPQKIAKSVHGCRLQTCRQCDHQPHTFTGVTTIQHKPKDSRFIRPKRVPHACFSVASWVMISMFSILIMIPTYLTSMHVTSFEQYCLISLNIS